MSARTAARIAAVQALYQIEMTGLSAEEVVSQFLAGQRPSPEVEDEDFTILPDPDPNLFRSIVDGVVIRREELDEAIGSALSKDWTVARLEILLRLMLEAGVFEITRLDDIPTKVSINEYVEVSKAFFDGPEPSLLNAVLDAVGKARAAALAPREKS